MNDSTPPSRLSIWTSGLLGLAAIVGVLWLGVWLIGKLPSNLTTAVITGGLAVVGSTIAIVAGKHYDRKKEIEAAFREKKIAIYDEFMEKLFLLFNRKEGEKLEVDMVEYLRTHQRKLILWSGDKAVHEYAEMMRAFRTGTASARSMVALENYFLAVREDLGHSNKEVVAGDLISFIMVNGDLLMKLYIENPETAMDRLVELEAKAKGKG